MKLVRGSMYVSFGQGPVQNKYMLDGFFGRALSFTTQEQAEKLAATWNGAPRCTQDLKVVAMSAAEAKELALTEYLGSIAEMASLGLQQNAA